MFIVCNNCEKEIKTIDDIGWAEGIDIYNLNFDKKNNIEYKKKKRIRSGFFLCIKCGNILPLKSEEEVIGYLKNANHEINDKKNEESNDCFSYEDARIMLTLIAHAKSLDIVHRNILYMEYYDIILPKLRSYLYKKDQEFTKKILEWR
jgi:hypothetical protein